ncbi:MAG: cation-transporting P-type ATPase [Clostridia bacterium]|nr:cation-transporting P-type ATPase [Clostridia bacterium]
MTCDDVNDLPSLGEADFGCALGQTAAHSVKAASDFIVDDNKFSTLVLALKESNRVFDGVLRNIKFIVTSVAAQIAILLLGIIIFGASPLTAAAIMWLNLIAFLPTLIAFGSENSSATLSLRRHESRELISTNSIVSIALPSLVITVMTLIAYGIGLSLGATAAATLSFAVLGVSNIVHSFTLSHTYTVFQKGTIRNLIMPMACLVSLALLLLVLLTPFGVLFSLTSLSGYSLLAVLISAVVTLGVGELTKFIAPRIKLFQ